MIAPGRARVVEPAAALGARVALLVACLSGVLVLFLTALAGSSHAVVVAAGCGLLCVTAAWAPVAWPTPHGNSVRRMVSFALLAITLLLCLVNLVRMEPSQVADLSATFGGFLARLLIAVLLAQLFVSDKMRDLRVALLLAGGMFVLALSNEPGPMVVVALLVGWPAIVSVLAFDHAAREQGTVDLVARPAGAGEVPAPARALDAAGPGWGRVAGFTAVSAVAALVLVLLVPHPEGVQQRQVGAGGGTSDGTSPGSSSPSRDAEAYTSGSLDMRQRGDLPTTEIADVPLDSPALWRGAVLDYYDGTTWRAPAEPTYGTSVDGGPHFQLPAVDGQPSTGAPRRDDVHLREGFPGVLLAPGRPDAVDWPGQLLRLSGGYFLGADGAGSYAHDYAVASTATDLPDVQLAGTPVAVPAGQDFPAGSLQLPSTVPARVWQLGRQLAGTATDRLAATRAVEGYLRTHATYRLDSPVPPSGADAVDHFLFEARTGFCEQFAAAEVVLLRAAGVPARLATGFAGGTASGDHRTLRGSDAHAWVEVWYPGHGWSASDPTAGTRLADPTLRDKVSSLLDEARSRLIIAVALVGLAVLVGLLVWFWRRRARRRAGPRGQSVAEAALPPVLAAFERLERALSEVGTPRDPSESVSELARRPALRDAVGALAVVERTSYAAAAPVGAVADDAVRTLDDVVLSLRPER